MMATSREILKIVGLAGLALLIGQGCSQKSVNVTADAETFEQGSQYADGQHGAGNPFTQGYGSSSSQQGGAGASSGEFGTQNWAQGGSPNYGANGSSSSSPAISGPLANLREYGSGWNEQDGSMANEFIQQDYDNIAEAQSQGFGQSGEYGYGSQSYGQGQGEYGNPHTRVQVELQDVFFEIDSWRISQDGRQALAHDADWISQNQARSLTVEGHCDQRGTRDYNVVLGKKRAEAVRAYLVDLGVESHKIQVISYGKERPFCYGSDEQCYQLNRRGHMQLHQ
jgi:peptidoglycan-associated lipoprotein